MRKQKTHNLRNRILYTIVVLMLYLAGRSIFLYGVSGTASGTADTSSQSFILTMLNGSKYPVTIMALGIMPYINASLVVQIFVSLRSSDARAKISKQRSDHWMRIATIAFAVLMALAQSADLVYMDSSLPGWVSRGIVIAEMFGGSMLVYGLCIGNEEHGIGTAMPIILVNIITLNAEKLQRYHFLEYPVLIAICLVVLFGTLFMENKLIKIPLQRVSIHNVYADKNYIAYKPNPVGIMPVMFATSAFLVPQYLFVFLRILFPENETITAIGENMTVDHPLGIAVYLVVIFILDLAFSMIMLNPAETAKQFQRNGDSIEDLNAGEETRRYLVRLVLKWSIISGWLQAGCMGMSLTLAYLGKFPADLAMIPAVLMIAASIICSLAQEIASYRRYDAYDFFL